MLALALLLRWMHIFGAIMLVGGTIFMRCAYVPALSADPPSDDLSRAVRARWARLVMMASSMLLVSGLVNFVLIVKQNTFAEAGFPGRGGYHMIFGIKFLLAFVVFFLAAALAGRSGLAEKLRRKEKSWLTVNLVLAVVIVCLAGVMKLAAREPKPDSSAIPVRTAACMKHGEFLAERPRGLARTQRRTSGETSSKLVEIRHG